MIAIFNDAYDRGGQLIFSITYVDDNGSKTTIEEVAQEDITTDFLSQIAFNQASRFSSAKTRKLNIAVPFGFNIPIVELVLQAPKPTQDEIDMNNYFEGKRVVMILQNLLEVGRKEVTQEMLNNAKTAWNNMRLDPAWESITQDELNILLNGTP